jgi:hypothetical protein
MAAGWWAFCASYGFLAIAPITWVVYLVNRKKLIAKAKEHPVVLTLTHRLIVAALVIVLPVLIGILLDHSHE